LNRIQELAAKYADQVIAYRRHMHMYPEVSLEEKETAKYPKAMGIPSRMPFLNAILLLIKE